MSFTFGYGCQQKADALVTGHKDLLALADSFQIPILEPAAVKEQLWG